MINSLKSQFDELNPFGRLFFALGLVSLAVAAGMTFKFGWSMSVLHAVGLGVLSIVAAVLPEAAYRMGEDGKRGLAVVVGLLTVPVIAVEYFSHTGYTIGQRVGNVQQASVHNTKFDDGRNALESDRISIDVLRKQQAAIHADQPWIATVKAAGLKADLVPIDKAVELETARGGCKSKCQTLMQKKADIEKRIATAEKSEDYASQIEALQKRIDAKTETASTQEFESSPVVNQTDFAAKMVAYDLAPSPEVREATQIGISASLSLANLLLAPLCFLVAGRNRRQGYVAHYAEYEPEPAKMARPPVALPTHTTNTVVRERVIDDRNAVKAILETLRDGLRQPLAA